MARWLSPNLPDGPLKELNRELHELHRKAGYPSVRELQEAIGKAASHTKIHHAFTKPKVPSWGVVELAVEALAAQARPRVDPEAEVDRFKALWDRASVSGSGTADDSQADAARAQIRATEERQPEPVRASGSRLENPARRLRGDLATARYAVDIVLCIDITGSMQPIIQEVREGAFSFHAKLASTMHQREKRVDQMRIRVVAFRDFIDSPQDALHASPFFKVPHEVHKFEKFVSSLSAGGGGDIPESGLEALSVAIDSDWQRNLTRQRHVIVMFTDAPAHPLGGPTRQSDGYPEGIPSSFEELSERWGAHGDPKARMDEAAKRLILFCPDASPWGEIADEWNNVIWFSSKAGAGLMDVEMELILDAIASSI
ncbi:hypothetical protein [Streptomyces sp900105755]|uniref:Hemicentin-1-like von Willebrand factor A domain-containing protein n=1 Tax=Streptomyces sp. 900105755 TaxID=3154389 RepID=A0ABV1TWY8_9ACTN